MDEPDTKVPWQLTLDVPNDMIAVSNTPIESESPLPEGGRRVTFTRTQPLPSYLIAFGVGPFDIVDGGATKSGVPIRVFTLQGRGREAAYAARTSRRVLEILEDWYGIPYPYGKLDMLTIPLTVGFGAMENAGLITYSERLILIDPERPSWSKRHRWIARGARKCSRPWRPPAIPNAPRSHSGSCSIEASICARRATCCSPRIEAMDQCIASRQVLEPQIRAWLGGLAIR